MENLCERKGNQNDRHALPNELPTAARQPASFRGSAVCRASVDNSASVPRTRVQITPGPVLRRNEASSADLRMTHPLRRNGVVYRYCVTNQGN
jgi:hypothetical protein